MLRSYSIFLLLERDVTPFLRMPRGWRLLAAISSEASAICLSIEVPTTLTRSI